MKRKLVSLLCAAVFCSSALGVFAADDNTPAVAVGMNYIEFTDAVPYFDGDNLMLPVRAVAENLGCDVGWEESTGMITIKGIDSEAAFTMGASEATVNGEKMTLRAPVAGDAGRTYMNYIDLIVCVGSGFMAQYVADENYVTIRQGNILEVTEEGIKDWSGKVLSDEELDAMADEFPDGFIDELKAERDSL